MGLASWLRLNGARKSDAHITRQMPPECCLYAIGDVHGRSDLLANIIRQIQDDQSRLPENYRRIVVYLGDYVDRGLDSRGVIDLILSDPLPGFETVFLKGNHEDSMLRFLDDPETGHHWLSIGGKATVMSYDVRVPRDLPSSKWLDHLWRGLSNNLPDKHLDFLKNLRMSYICGDYIFVHAGLRPNQSIDSQSPEDVLWIRDEFLGSSAEWGKLVVHGHTPMERPQVRNNRISIDTGAFASNTLTCLVLEGATNRFLATGAD